MYYRAYIVDPSLSTNGEPIGGLKGFLKILQKLTRDIKPDSIIIVWDGAGGSQKRKSYNKNYKEGRKPIRLNRDIKNLTANEEIQNKIWQQTRLIEYLNDMPLIQFMEPSIEADDIIAHITQAPLLKGIQKIIVSSDKDFYQLCDKETIVFRPIQKEILNTSRLVDKHGIHPTNFALARAIVGDKSDNLLGVPGVGMPTMMKRFKFLSEEKTYTIDDVLDFCKSVENPLQAHRNILENKEVIEKNYKIMQLYVPLISVQTKQKINNILKTFEYEFNQTAVHVKMIKDGFGVFNWDSLFSLYKKIVVDNKEVFL